MATERPIQYEPHPVTPERKKQLIDAGYRILDVKFKPKGTPAKAESVESADIADIDDLSAADLKAELTAKGIYFPANATKAKLADLLKAAE